MKEIDAVLIGSCEHQHAPHLIATVEAGKDSYCEKPMSHSIEEGVKMVKAVRNTDRIVQVGMQRRSSPAVHEAKNTVIDQGWLGNIYMVKAIWNWNYSSKLNNSPLGGELDWEAFCYPARVSEFEPMKYRYWRYFWDFSVETAPIRNAPDGCNPVVHEFREKRQSLHSQRNALAECTRWKVRKPRISLPLCSITEISWQPGH